MSGPRDERLWCAVIMQALDDATMKVTEIQPHHNTTRRAELRLKAADRDEARRWLLENDRDMPAVCGLAGLDSAKVREFARKHIDDFSAGNSKLGRKSHGRHARSISLVGA